MHMMCKPAGIVDLRVLTVIRDGAEWELKGDHPLRYFLEPAYLTMNYAKAQGYDDVYMAGLSGGGWSTTFASAIDNRIKGSFPIAGWC